MVFNKLIYLFSGTGIVTGGSLTCTNTGTCLGLEIQPISSKVIVQNIHFNNSYMHCIGCSAVQVIVENCQFHNCQSCINGDFFTIAISDNSFLSGASMVSGK